MTPEQLEIARSNAQRIVNAGGTDAIDYPVAVGFLSLIAQVEALEARLNTDKLPDDEQEWAKVDPATAFHLIERHSDNWSDAGAMMVAWADARNGAKVKALTNINDRKYRLSSSQLWNIHHVVKNFNDDGWSPGADVNDALENLSKAAMGAICNDAPDFQKIDEEVARGGSIMGSRTIIYRNGAYILKQEISMGGECWKLDGPTIPAIPATKEDAT